MNLYIYGQLFFDKGIRIVHRRKIFPTNEAIQIIYSYKNNFYPYLTLTIKLKNGFLGESPD
jgi:hypothetical protein